MTVLLGDCIETMRQMDAGSVDAVVCDPPYGLEFMGKEWDSFRSDDRDVPGYNGRATGTEIVDPYSAPPTMLAFQNWTREWAREALRVLKPGGHLLAFGGTRTYHRLAAGIEDAGFEIRDTLAWMYGSGFPKSLDVSKAIDKAAGAEREVISLERSPFRMADPKMGSRWQGWGTALKPAYEPVVVARKPLSGTVAANVLQHGTGALNIDGTRIGDTVETWPSSRGGNTRRSMAGGAMLESDTGLAPSGRWPANVLLDEHAAALLDEQTGELSSGANPTRRSADGDDRQAFGKFAGQESVTPARGAESGAASRFFYVAKASSAERNAGLDWFPAKEFKRHADERVWDIPGSHSKPRANVHPTVKPVEVMRWLIRLVTSPDGTVLDPFTGSGTTGIAAHLEGVQFIGIEREPEYHAIAKARIAWWQARTDPGAPTDAPLKANDPHPDQLDLFAERAA